jgi:hypothetical protein
MSALTDRLYRQWLAQNRGGIGGVAPDAEPKRRPADSPARVRFGSPAKGQAARPAKRS